MPADDAFLLSLAGRFIVIDGPDGSGKSTQVRRLAGACRDAGVQVCAVREPGGTPVGEHVRRVLLDHASEGITLRCEMLLYMASRAQLVERVMRPALDRGELVLADRFVSSTLAYQGAGGGLAHADILAVARVATAGLEPDLVVILDVDAATARARLGARPDRIEAMGEAYHARVRRGFIEQASRDPASCALVDARPGEDAVFNALLGAIRDRLPPR